MPTVLRNTVTNRLAFRCSSSGFSRALVTSRLSTSVRYTHVARPRRQVTQMGLFGLGGPELLVIAGVAALIFGPSKLPELGRSFGKTMKGVRQATEEFQEEMKKEMDKDDDNNEGPKKEVATSSEGSDR